MKKKESVLFLIYRYFTPIGRRPCYGVYRFFNEEGEVDKGLLEETFLRREADYRARDLELLQFSGLENLKEYSMDVCIKLGIEKVRLLSLFDFNQGLLDANDCEDFKMIFWNKGLELQNPEINGKNSGGILSRLFS